MALVAMCLSNPYRPDRRVRLEALSLLQAGYEVLLYAWDRAGTGPSHTSEEGVQVERLRILAPQRDPLRHLPALFRFWAALLSRLLRSSPELIHAHDLDTLPPAFLAAKLRGAALVYDAHELYAEMIADEVPRLGPRLVAWAEARLLPHVDLVVTVTPWIEEDLRRRGARETIVVMNGEPLTAPPSPEATARAQARLPGRELLLFYAGVLEPRRALEELIALFRTAPPDGWRFALAGYGTLEAQLRAQAASCAAIEVLGFIPLAELPAYTRRGDLILALYDPANRNNRCSVPNRLFEGWAAEKPVLVAEGSFAAQLVSETGAGMVVRYGDAEAIRAALAQLKGDSALRRTFASRARIAAATYSWEVMGERLVRSYRALEARRAARV